MVAVTRDGPALSVKAVIYATDFSICSENAALYARFLAKRFSAKLLVAHAFTASQAALAVETDPSIVSRQRKNLQLLLSSKALALASDSIDAIPVLLEGDPRKMIPDLADKNAPSLIVLGTHGGGRVERGLIGSEAEGILRSTRWPCLTVGPDVPSASSAAFAVHRILYVTDFTPAAARAAAYAVFLADTLSADVDVLNVIQREAVDHPDRLGDLTSRFYTGLEDRVPQRAKEFTNPRTFVEVGKAHEEILRHIRERSIDLLVLGVQKTSHLGMTMRTSGAFQLIVDAECPVLTITG